MNIEEAPLLEMSNEDKIMVIATRILREHRQAFLELAKQSGLQKNMSSSYIEGSSGKRWSLWYKE